jgi:hypothetical protein
VYVNTRMLSAHFMCLLGRRDKCDKTCYHPVTRFLTLSEIMKQVKSPLDVDGGEVLSKVDTNFNEGEAHSRADFNWWTVISRHEAHAGRAPVLTCAVHILLSHTGPRISQCILHIVYTLHQH